MGNVNYKPEKQCDGCGHWNAIENTKCQACLLAFPLSRTELESQLAAANERVETLHKEREEFYNKWMYENARRRDDEGVWLETRDANKRMGEEIKRLTERAVRAEKVVAECEASGFVTKDGTARKVNGTLCLDDDGVIVADGATVYFVDEFGDIVEYDCRGIEGSIPSGLFWSTKEALDKARKQGGRA